MVEKNMSEMQEMTCRIEIGIPKKDIGRDALKRFLLEVHMYISGIREICNCPIIGWGSSPDEEFVEEIPDFNSWGFHSKPENTEYTVFRMYKKCYAPKYDIFGIKTGKPHAAIEERTKKCMKIIINVTGRSPVH